MDQKPAAVVSRNQDPQAFGVPPEIIAMIPENIRQQNKETFKTGGLNFYTEEALRVHPSERDGHFVFSISMANALKLPREVHGNFNFPASEKYPQGLIQAT